MKIEFRKIILVSILFICFVGFFAHTAMAEGENLAKDIAGNIGTAANVIGGPFTKVILTQISFLADILSVILSWILSLSGTLLNVGMYFTTHLDIFIRNNHVIYDVWKIIRDISSLFLIFLILWAAITMILSRRSANFGEFIKNIIIMGVLINFSFFFTQVMIDGSNIISLQFYNALAPNNAASTQKLEINEITKALYDSGSGGISDIIMGSLHINQLWQNRGQLTSGWTDASGNIDASFRIILITVIKAIIIVSASISFLAVAAACIWRIGILLMLLAFSPLWIAGMVLPKLGDFTSMWTKHLKAQLIFLPVYLLLMYVVIRILTESSLKTFTDNIGVNSGSGIALDYINLFIGAAIVLFLINIPLVTALSVAGASGTWTEKMFTGMKSWTQNKLGTSAKTFGQATWTQTGSRVASRIASSKSFQGLAGKSWFGEQALKGTRTAAKNYDKKLETKIKSKQDFAQSLNINKQAKADYAKRLYTSPAAEFSAFGTIGRSDRVAAAKILRTRLAEIKTELNKLIDERNKYQRTQTAGTTLSPYETERLDFLNGTNNSGKNTGPKPKNEIKDEQENKDDIEKQIETFEKSVFGASARDVEKRQY